MDHYLTLVQIAEPDQSGMGVWQIRQGSKVHGHIVATEEAASEVREGLKLLAAAIHVAKGAYGVPS